MVMTDTKVDALAANGATYNYSGINYNIGTKDIVSSIKAIQDGSFESKGYNPDGKRGSIFQIGENNVKHGLTLGAGLSYKINPKINIGCRKKSRCMITYPI